MKDRIWLALIVTIGLQFGLVSEALADASADKFIQDAKPLMHHSCASVVEEADGDDFFIEQVIRALVAVSLYNHEIDISEYAKSDSEKTALRDKFVDALKTECENDNDALLAGAVDDAIVQALPLN